MIVSMHVATGAAAGALLRRPLRAAFVGPALHFIADWIPHRDIPSRRFEIVSGAIEVAALALVRGPLDAATVGAIAAAAPDVEHVVRLPRPRGRKLFPSHRVFGWHRGGGVRTSVQLVVAGMLLGAVAGSRERTG